VGEEVEEDWEEVSSLLKTCYLATDRGGRSGGRVDSVYRHAARVLDSCVYSNF
jgi:hypothetical protein